MAISKAGGAFASLRRASPGFAGLRRTYDPFGLPYYKLRKKKEERVESQEQRFKSRGLRFYEFYDSTIYKDRLFWLCVASSVARSLFPHARR